MAEISPLRRCADCGLVRIAYNSCRNRHCPKRQGLARAQSHAAPSRPKCRPKLDQPELCVGWCGVQSECKVHFTWETKRWPKSTSARR